jgi:hypothetical protein
MIGLPEWGGEVLLTRFGPVTTILREFLDAA